MILPDITKVPAIEWETGSLSYSELAMKVAELSTWLSAQSFTRIAVDMVNGPEWVIIDLACQRAGKMLVPVPPFFSREQRTHLLAEAGVELCFCSQPVDDERFEYAACPLSDTYLYRLSEVNEPVIPKGTGKITFTSGSTGNPKGVCLSHQSQEVVAESVVKAIGLSAPRHLCLLPLATLLENVAGVYAPLLAGGTVVLRNPQSLGFAGTSLTNPQAMLATISEVQPNSLILVPELLQLLIMGCAQGWTPPVSLKFIAVGGAHVAEGLLQKARALGLPVYQGYGLSECVSVNTLNTPSCERMNSVGKSLGHNTLRIENGELKVSGTIFLGYLNAPETFYPTEVATGDLIREEDGFYVVEGRKKHLFINSFGRNISPEWVESELMASGLFRHAFVVGEARPHCGALITPLHNGLPRERIEEALASINQRLPDYAAVRVWQVLPDLSAEKNLFTANGKLKRQALTSRFATLINELYADTGSLTEETEA